MSKFLVPPSDDFKQHVAKIIMLGFAVGFVIDAIVYANRYPVWVSVVQRNQIEPFDHFFVLARPKLIDQRRLTGGTRNLLKLVRPYF